MILKGSLHEPADVKLEMIRLWCEIFSPLKVCDFVYFTTFFFFLAVVYWPHVMLEQSFSKGNRKLSHDSLQPAAAAGSLCFLKEKLKSH